VTQVFDMGPLKIDAKELTKFVLSLLQPLLLPGPTVINQPVHETDSCPGAQLPQELLNMIEAHLPSAFIDPDPTPSRLLPRSWWREVLINKKLRPWLWDLDEEMIRSKACKPPRNWFGAPGTRTEWDWESLVRKLTQTDLYKNIGVHTAGAGTVLALKNRRRIFLILDDLARTQPSQPRMEELVDWEDTDCPDR
jgi:hypothetical protein